MKRTEIPKREKPDPSERRILTELAERSLTKADWKSEEDPDKLALTERYPRTFSRMVALAERAREKAESDEKPSAEEQRKLEELARRMSQPNSAAVTLFEHGKRTSESSLMLAFPKTFERLLARASLPSPTS